MLPHEQLEHLLAGLAGGLQALDVLLALEVLADGDELHFGGNDAPARVVHLCDVALAFSRQSLEIEAKLGQLWISQALLPEQRRGPRKQFRIVSFQNPRLA